MLSYAYLLAAYLSGSCPGFRQIAWAPIALRRCPTRFGVGAASAAARRMSSALPLLLIKAIRLSDPSCSNNSWEMGPRTAHIAVHG